MLLIACANVANLLLARSASRAGEIAVRLAIGAGRGRLISQLLAEAMLLAGLAGIASIGVAKATLVGIGSMVPADATAMIEFTLDIPTVVFAGALALATGLVFGLFPALESTRVDLAATLNGQAGRRSSSSGAARFRVVLVTGQIALSTTLLISAGLFTKSLANISRVDLGLDVDNLVTFAISPSRNGYTLSARKRSSVPLKSDSAPCPVSPR